MNENLQQLEEQRAWHYQELSTFGDFRLGSISETHTRCGKKNCACADKRRIGHIRYLWSATRHGKSIAQNLRLGPEMEQAQLQVEEGHRFQKWFQKSLELNEKICRLRPIPEVEDEKELTALKKKLQRNFAQRRKKKLTV